MRKWVFKRCGACWRLASAVSLLLVFWVASAQDAVRPAFEKTRYDEDWSLLRDPERRTEPLDELKFIALNDGASRWLSLGGEGRWHYEYTRNPAWGADPESQIGVLLQRYLLHGDLHVGPRLRFFGQLYSAVENDRPGATTALDENRLDVQHAFADIVLGDAGETAPILRMGRQEMSYGSSRLIDVREGPNVRRTFESVRLLGHAGSWRLDAIAARPMRVQVGSFDDEVDHDQALWGMYASRGAWESLPLDSAVDVYYLGYRNRAARYDQGSGDELRHTLGVRLWRAQRSWDWNWEFILQGGRFDDDRIAAWSIATDTGHTWMDARGQPRFGLSINAASGDTDPGDGDLQSFNAMFPRGNYFSELALLGPRNFVNLHPSISFRPTPSLVVTMDVDFFWRLRTEDGVYTPGGGLLRGAQGSDAHFVGTELSFNTKWQINRWLALTVIHSHFVPGRFIRDTGPARHIGYYECTLQAKF